MIKSPLTGGPTTLTKKIPTEKIISAYSRYTDIRRFFTTLKTVDLYTCVETGLEFFEPPQTAGDSKFYEDLSQEPLYYVDWKDEHVVADSYIKSGDTVLEQGCATGAFLLKEVSSKQIIPYGTELNEVAKKEAADRGIRFASLTSADVTCSFQVLEHIAEPRAFITDAIQATKSGGYIIFSVPNNDGFLKDDPFCYLNMPPHHMGLWKEDVFKTLPQYFPIEFVAAHTEHLQPNHYRTHYQIYFGKYFIPFGIVGKIINKVTYSIVGRFIIAKRAPKLPGHTIVAVFKKTL